MEQVCFPEPLGCFAIPSAPSPNRTPDSEYTDEFILSQPHVLAALRAQDPPGCSLCVADTFEEEE